MKKTINIFYASSDSNRASDRHHDHMSVVYLSILLRPGIWQLQVEVVCIWDIALGFKVTVLYLHY